MAISNEAVLKKMMTEIQEAMQKNGETSLVREHVRAVRLLCDLMLEEHAAHSSGSSAYPDPTEVDEPTTAEIRKMMGDLPSSRQQTDKQKKQTTDHEEANGDSIFDF
ncbi:YwdI family protein [Thalassobacillus devorans]|uniref:YwdI family protein n=1 Tax=Thalassobacillus devorans TaxID=279813 RepID=UPI00048E95BC|nr:YwdI family protein [Thalassobacillus devorans]